MASDIRQTNDDVPTQYQVRPHETYRPEVLRERQGTLRDADAPRTYQLARPQPWTHRTDLPCLDRWHLFDMDRGAALAAAVQVCNIGGPEGDPCPVRELCLSEALAEEGMVGAQFRFLVRGGKTPAERAGLVLTSL